MATNNSVNVPIGTTGQLLVGISGAAPAFGSSAAADFTFTTATAGTTRTLTVSNTNNSNTASNALLAVTTGGASAGDAYHTVSTTTTTWAFGVDNSVTSPTADPFVISQNSTLGTNNVMSVATNGAINYPLQPSFLAVNNADQNNVTGDGTDYTITFVNEIFDQGNNFDGTSTFTAPVTGRYLFNTVFQLSEMTSAMTNCLSTFVTSNATYRPSQGNYWAQSVQSGGSGLLQINMTIIADMDAGDTCVVKTRCIGGTKVADVQGATAAGFRTPAFAGYLIC